MVLYGRVRAGGLAGSEVFVCEDGCQAQAVILTGAGQVMVGGGVLLALGAAVAAFASGSRDGLASGLAALALAALFAGLGYARLRDDRRNPPC
jgi:hypothetical protein